MTEHMETSTSSYPSPDEEAWSSDEWVHGARQLLTHKLTRIITSNGGDHLNEQDVVDTIMDELRSFVPLKVKVESLLLESDDLAAVNNNLLDYARRVLLAAHQVIHNNISATNEGMKVRGQSLKRLQSQTEPHRRMLLEWQLRRTREARQQFLDSAAAVDGPYREIVEEISKAA